MTGQTLTATLRAPRPTRSAARSLGLLALAIVYLIGVPLVRADQFVDRVNDRFSSIRENRRSDPIILAALAGMQPPPAGVSDPVDAALLPTSSARWAEAEAWATAAPQAAVLDAIHQVGQDPGDERPMAFAQPYGLAELGGSSEQIALIQAGLYTDLGDPPLLSAAKHLYLDRFDDAAALVQVEATRRLSAGDAAGALELLADWLMFARQIADREFHAEKVWALGAMSDALRRMRDVTYADFRGERSLTSRQIIDLNERIRDERDALAIDRLTLPTGDFVGAEQLIETVMVNRGRIRPEIFASTMARLASTERPLRLFGEAARWERVAEAHADWFATNEALSQLRSDYDFRWSRDRGDPLLAQPFVIENLSARPFMRDAVAVVSRSLPDMRDLFTGRLLLRLENIGTRDALGLVGFYYETGAYPLDLSAIRPRFVKELEGDPFAPRPQAGRRPPLTFFVPVRDTRDRFSARQTTPPHEMTILLPDTPNVSVSLRDDQFVLYSMGADGARQWAEEVQNSPNAPPGRDYLLWPPVLSIVRDSLVQSGDLD